MNGTFQTIDFILQIKLHLFSENLQSAEIVHCIENEVDTECVYLSCVCVRSRVCVCEFHIGFC